MCKRVGVIVWDTYGLLKTILNVRMRSLRAAVASISLGWKLLAEIKNHEVDFT